jgi:hypothetical protein
MIALVSVSWQKRLWLAFLKWLMEPIPFPGMTYELNEPPREDRVVSSE